MNYNLLSVYTFRMQEEIKQLKKEALLNIENTQEIEKLNDLRIKFLGKKGEFTKILKELKNLSDEQKRVIGPLAQKARREVASFLEEKITQIEQQIEAQKEWVDVTAPGVKIAYGHLHPC